MRFYRAEGTKFASFGFAADPEQTRRWAAKRLKNEGDKAEVDVCGRVL